MQAFSFNRKIKLRCFCISQLIKEILSVVNSLIAKNTSRIAAQHAKAEINAIVRNSAREQIYEEFSGRIGDLISGTVLQSTPDFTIVKIREGVEAELPHFDQRRYEN